ncbi:MAG: PAS domain S-box protein, partial [Verrucomicrobia bacterium]|nr:PAS domain S-box protein [Verrucomicrobiota bacterium]
DMPLVVGGEAIRFYAGVSLVAPSGSSVGTICVMDRSPRKLTESQRESLVALGCRVVERLELRKRMRLLEVEARAQSELLTDGEIVGMATDLSGAIHYFNRAAERLLGYSSKEMMGRTLASLRGVSELPGGGQGGKFGGGNGEEVCLCKDGGLVRVRVLSRLMKDSMGVMTGTFTVLQKVNGESGEVGEGEGGGMGGVVKMTRRLERVLIGLGVMAIFLIVGIFMIARQLQKEHHETQVAFKDATLEFALSHLWLEQLMAGDTDHEFGRDVNGKLDNAGVFLKRSEVSDLAAGLSLLSSMDNGVNVEGGKRLKKMAAQLEEWRKLAVERWSDPLNHRMGGRTVQRCDELFEEIMSDGESYGEFLGKVEACTENLIRKTFLLLGFILVVMVGIAVLIFRRARVIEERLRVGLMSELQVTDDALAKEVSESRMGREELAMRERQMTEFFNRSNDFILAVGEDGRIVFANRAWQVVMGYSREESLGINLFDLLVLETREDELKSFQTIFRGEVVGVAEISILTKGGEKIELLGNMQLEGVGEEKRVWGIFRNETEMRSVARSQKKYLEQKARFNEALLMVRDQLEGSEFDCDALATRTISDILGVDRVSVWQFRDEPRAIDCQGLFQRSEGRFELLEMSLLEADYPGYFAAVSGYRPVLASDARRDPMTSEFTDGYLVPLGIFSMLDVPLRLGEVLVGVLCCEQLGAIRQWTADEVKFVTDVVSYLMLAKERISRAKVEAELLRHEERNRLLVEGSQLALVSIDQGTRRFTFGNPAALELLGVKEMPEFLELGLADISAGRQADGEDSRAGAEVMMTKAFEIGTFSGDWIFRRGAWSIFIGTITLRRLEQDGQPFLHGVVRDISAQKLA